jgi:hypothetical protein
MVDSPKLRNARCSNLRNDRPGSPLLRAAPRQQPHHLHGPVATDFVAQDPTQLRVWVQLSAYRLPLLDAVPHDTPGTYTLVGSRQIGKSTRKLQGCAAVLLQLAVRAVQRH